MVIVSSEFKPQIFLNLVSADTRLFEDFVRGLNILSSFSDQNRVSLGHHRNKKK